MNNSLVRQNIWELNLVHATFNLNKIKKYLVQEYSQKTALKTFLQSHRPQVDTFQNNNYP